MYKADGAELLVTGHPPTPGVKWSPSHTHMHTKTDVPPEDQLRLGYWLEEAV